ncbi:MAG TPA: aminopeptidase [Verrucomicrobiae bacterium]|nr:aminopeptidase [Verrucomicrobiae bacterium]
MLAGGCQTARFYRQAVGGQWEIMAKCKSIERVLAEPETPEPMRRQLQLVRELCAFAETELELPARGQFTRYADLERPFVVWNIYAAPAFSLEAKSWWYPLVGRLKYQGYFQPEEALAYAGRLREEGFDVFVGGVTAYSTLGWFNDPVLNTFVHLPEDELADLIFHELAHQRLFIPGDTDFNEAFATAVARAGVRRWFERRGDLRALAAYEANRQAEDAAIALILATRDRLEELYTSAVGFGAERLVARKAEVIADLRVRYRELREQNPGYQHHDDWINAPINNAQFNTVDTYYQMVPGFEAKLQLLAGDLPSFYESIADLRRLSPDARRRSLSEAVLARSTKPGVLPDEPEGGAVQDAGHRQSQPEQPGAQLVAEHEQSQPAAHETAEQNHQ